MLRIMPIHAFQDNYLWLFHRNNERQACVVDPGDATPVLAALEQHDLVLSDILITHHHADHTGGIDELLSHFSVPVHGPHSTRIPQISNPLEEGDVVRVLGNDFRVIAVPGHTLDHIAFFCAAQEEQAPILFCGDTLFVAGCGRLFEGDPAMMYDSLGKLSQLPAETRVYCAHEYTLSNLAFAQAVLPRDAAVDTQLRRTQRLRDDDKPTVPSTIGEELLSNPFLRCHQEDLAASLRTESGLGENALTPVEVFAGIREWKDRFRG